MKTRFRTNPTHRRARRGFTLIELIIAGVIMAFILGSVTISLAQLSRMRNSSRGLLAANLRAHTAIMQVRKQVVSAMRSDDLFYMQIRLTDDESSGMPRDELLVFNNSLRSIRNEEYNGEGIEYETEFIIIEDAGGPVLWMRRDAVLDENHDGGGRAEPLVEGIIGLDIQVYDGYDWWDEWDSDIQGMPEAVRITIEASGHKYGEDEFGASRTALRTIVPIDRLAMPRELVLPTPEEEEALAEELNALLAPDDAEGDNGDADGAGDGAGSEGRGEDGEEGGGGGGGFDGNNGGGNGTGRGGGGGGAGGGGGSSGGSAGGRGNAGAIGSGGGGGGPR